MMMMMMMMMIEKHECGAVGGMRTGTGNRSTDIKPIFVSFSPPQIPHLLIRNRKPGPPLQEATD
jgi:hypothetical protein